MTMITTTTPPPPTTVIDFEVESGQHNQRLDKALTELYTAAITATQGDGDILSRARIQGLIADGHVFIGHDVCRQSSRKMKEGEQITLHVPPPVTAEPEAQNIPLDIVYEDMDMLVINKAAGMVVHPAAGHDNGTLVNALLYHCKDDLSGIGGVMRPGIVHRLDKETSGLICVAKSDRAHKGLSDQLQDRSLSRIYHAIVTGIPIPALGSIDMPIGRHRHSRLKMAIQLKSGRQAKTHYKTLQTYDKAISHIECKLESGRTHQIRVHMQSIKNYIVGDPLYGPQPTLLKSLLEKADYTPEIITRIMAFPRQALHAHTIAFIHPVTGDDMQFHAPLPEDMQSLITDLKSIL